MPKENERKFLVDQTLLPPLPPGVELRQGYLSRATNATVRVRILTPAPPEPVSARITVKGPGLSSRPEFEYLVPLAEAQEMLDQLCLPGQVHKTRYTLEFAGRTFEVDFFVTPRPGLVLAEVELADPDEDVSLPPWVTQEVTDDPAYYNANMSQLA